MEQTILESAAQYGFIGVICGVLLINMVWQNVYMHRKISNLIENNTTALTKLTDIVEGCPKREK